jgi:hypothetical protein
MMVEDEYVRADDFMPKRRRIAEPLSCDTALGWLPEFETVDVIPDAPPATSKNAVAWVCCLRKSFVYFVNFP